MSDHPHEKGQPESAAASDLHADVGANLVGVLAASSGPPDHGGLDPSHTGPDADMLAHVTDADVAGLVAQLGEFNFGHDLGLGDASDLTNIGAIVSSQVVDDILSPDNVHGLLNEVDLFNIPDFTHHDA